MTRIQIAVYDKLVAEAILENFAEADKLWARWCMIRYERKLPLGGAVINDAGMSRAFDAKVGDYIRH